MKNKCIDKFMSKIVKKLSKNCLNEIYLLIYILAIKTYFSVNFVPNNIKYEIFSSGNCF